MKVNGWLYKATRAPAKENQSVVKIHLGPGQEKYLEGWINVDANKFTGKCDVWADLRNPLPFKDSSVDAVYSHHMIEHLPDREAHLKEVFRVLKPGGVYRVAGPNGDTAVCKLQKGDKSWFNSWPDDRKSVGGRFENFIFCRGEHLTILFEDFMREMLAEAGFSDIKKCRAEDTTEYEILFTDAVSSENESDPENPRTLVLEAVKT